MKVPVFDVSISQVPFCSVMSPFGSVSPIFSGPIFHAVAAVIV